MFKAFQNAFKIPELKSRLLFTLMILAVYRVGAFIPVPGIDGGALATLFGDRGPSGLLGLYDLFVGGALQKGAIFALGIMPYISSSIIMQLLTSVVPTLEKIAKEGPEGRKKIVQYTRYGTIFLCIVQGFMVATMIEGMNEGAEVPVVPNPGLSFRLLAMFTLTTGTIFIMWLGEQISEKGIGNGISLIIAASIIARMPQSAQLAFNYILQGIISLPRAALMLVVMVLAIAGVVMLTQAQRRIPIQHGRHVRGRKVYGGGSSFLPLRVNMAGVIPIIFAQALLMFPAQILQSVDNPTLNRLFGGLTNWGGFSYNAIYFTLIIFFCYFYAAIQFNPIDVADNLKKWGSFIPGIRPGRTTAAYLERVLNRITLPGSMFLGIIAIFPMVLASMMDIDFSIASFFGGTSLLIIVGVTLDTVKQIETHLVMRHYDGFIEGGARIRGRRPIR